MNLLARLILAVGGLALLFSPTSGAENKQEEGERLIRQADQISNIRSADAPAFRLKASFKGLGDNAPAGEGTYTEIWVSRGRWRRETILGDFHRTEVGGVTRRWILDSALEISGKTSQLGTLMRIGDVRQEPIKVAAIRDRSLQGLRVRCVELKGGSVGNETLCIDTQRGVLVLRKTPNLWMGKKSEYSCQYGEYEQFAARMYPRHIQCMEGAQPGTEVRVLELSSAPSLDTTLFDPPIGAKELANCPGKIQAPKVLQAPEPEYPKGENQPSFPEVLSAIVGVDGKPRDLRVVRSIGRAFDKPALAAISQWIFKPAMCDGDSVPVQINVEVNFRK